MSRPRRFLLVGSPVAHSLSPPMHVAAMRAAGLDGSYETLNTDEEGLASAVGELRRGDLDGINVTMPLKEPAKRLVDNLTPEAEASGSVNALRVRDGLVEGHSTDVTAMTRLAESRCGHVQTALVLGAGGAARAAVHGLPVLNKYVSSRRFGQAVALSSLFERTTAVTWGSGVAGAILVNATPLGMEGEELPSRPVQVASCLVDLAYGSADTPAVTSARKRGLPVVDGVEFLAATASAAFKWWTGADVHFAVMLEAARKAKGSRS